MKLSITITKAQQQAIKAALDSKATDYTTLANTARRSAVEASGNGESARASLLIEHSASYTASAAECRSLADLIAEEAK